MGMCAIISICKRDSSVGRLKFFLTESALQQVTFVVTVNLNVEIMITYARYICFSWVKVKTIKDIFCHGNSRNNRFQYSIALMSLE